MDKYSTKSLLIVAFTIPLLATLSCCKHHESNNTQQQPVNANDYRDDMVRVNKILNEKEKEDIENYIKRHELVMETTGTGLRFNITNSGTGPLAHAEKVATIDYTISLLDGRQVYSSEELGRKKFLIGKGGVEAGLEEGILMMKVGDKAKFILPSHLAYGLAGDDNKIPSRAPLVYTVELLELKDQ